MIQKGKQSASRARLGSRWKGGRASRGSCPSAYEDLETVPDESRIKFRAPKGSYASAISSAAKAEGDLQRRGRTGQKEDAVRLKRAPGEGAVALSPSRKETADLPPTRSLKVIIREMRRRKSEKSESLWVSRSIPHKKSRLEGKSACEITPRRATPDEGTLQRPNTRLWRHISQRSIRVRRTIF